MGEIEIEDEGMRVSVRRADEVVVRGRAARRDPGRRRGGAAHRARRGPRSAVESPMVGVFYRSSSPGAPAFVEVGDVVTVGQTLCLLEAMKLFNELKAEQEGGEGDPRRERQPSSSAAALRARAGDADR